MRLDNRFHGRRRLFNGPSIVMKTMHCTDTSVSDVDTALRLKRINSKKDPYNLESHDVTYSLDKHKRWTIRGQIGKDIVDLQDDNLGLRVSATVHRLHRQKPRRIWQEDMWSEDDEPRRFRSTDERLNVPSNATIAYYDVKDGKEIHKTSKGARLHTLTEPPKPKRSKGKAAKASQNQESTKEPPQDTSVHVRYSILECVLPTKHFYSSSKHASSSPTEGSKKKKATQRNRLIEYEYDDWEEDYEEENYEDEDEPTPRRAPPTLNLQEYITTNDENVGKRDPYKIEATQDEDIVQYNPDLPLPSKQTSKLYKKMCRHRYGRKGGRKPHDDDYYEMLWRNENKEEVFVPEGPRVSLLEEIVEWRKRFSFPDGVELLPVFPPTTIIHYADSQRLLGERLTNCIVMKLFDGVTRVHQLNSCLACTYSKRHEQLGYLLEDTVPEENVLPSQQPEGDCPVCFGPMKDNYFSLRCAHAFCLECWKAYLLEAATNNNTLVTCMDTTCKQELSYAPACGLLSSETLVIYRQALEEKLLEGGRYHRCPSCRLLVTSEGKLSKCGCGTVSCTACGNVDHRPITCKALEDYQKLLEKNGMSISHPMAQSRHCVRFMVKCPSCSFHMQRSHGCDHMTCPQCSTEFCYRCGRPWTLHLMCPKIELKVFLVDNAIRTASFSAKHFQMFTAPRLLLKGIRDSLRKLPVVERRRKGRLLRKAIQTIEFVLVSEITKRREHLGRDRTPLHRLYGALHLYLNASRNIHSLPDKEMHLERAIQSAQLIH